MQFRITHLILKKDEKKTLEKLKTYFFFTESWLQDVVQSIYKSFKTVLTSIVWEDQICSIPGQTIFSNLALFRDAFDYITLANETGISASLHQEKPSDRVVWTFLTNASQKFVFGPVFQWMVWSVYSPKLSALLKTPFVAQVDCFCLPLGPYRAPGTTKLCLSLRHSFMISIFQNRATFHNRSKFLWAIVWYIKHDIMTRI